MGNVVISTPWPGLGDHLQFSTLPELYARQGHTVWVHKDAPFRNQEIRELVWDQNPYVAGFTDLPPNVGGGIACVRHVTDSIVSDWELAHGFGVVNHYPTLYYRPDTIGLHLENTILIDLTCVSDYYDSDVLWNAVSRIVYDDLRNTSLTHRVINFTNFKRNEVIFTEQYKREGYPEITIRSLKHYVDALASCAGIITLMSGAAVLASTLKRDEGHQRIDVLMAADKPIFKFRNAKYTVL